MHRSILAGIAVGATACGGAPDRQPPKRPNTELISGVFERHPPDGDTAIRFASGGYRVAKNRMQFDVNPPLGEGTFAVEGDQLTLTATKGMCADAGQVGVYKVVLSKIGIRFTKVSDSCERRAKMDGQTWWRAD